MLSEFRENLIEEGMRKLPVKDLHRGLDELKNIREQLGLSASGEELRAIEEAELKLRGLIAGRIK